VLAGVWRIRVRRSGILDSKRQVVLALEMKVGAAFLVEEKADVFRIEEFLVSQEEVTASISDSLPSHV